MNYQLVVQWPASAVAHYDAMIVIEGLLTEILSKRIAVDGHDMGSGQVNIFIRIDDPKQTFREIVTALGNRDLWSDARVAYREVTNSKYITRWPIGLSDFGVV